MDSANNDYINLFKTTALEHIEVSDEILNSQATISKDLASDFFRHIHSLKGSSAVMNFQQIANICSEIINLINKNGDLYSIQDENKTKIGNLIKNIKALLLAI